MGKMDGGSGLRQTEVLWVKIVGGYGLRYKGVVWGSGLRQTEVLWVKIVGGYGLR